MFDVDGIWRWTIRLIADVAGLEIGDRAGDPTDPVVAPSRQALALDLGAQPRLRRRRHRGVPVEQLTVQAGVEASLPLHRDRTRRRHAAGNGGTGLAPSRVEQIVDTRSLHRHPEVEAVEQRAGEAAGVAQAGDLVAFTAPGRPAAARARVGGGDELEPSRQDRVTRRGGRPG